MKAWPSKHMKTHWQHTLVDGEKTGEGTVHVSSLVCCRKQEIGKHMRAEEWSKEQEVGECKVSSSMEGKDRNRDGWSDRNFSSGHCWWANGEKEAKIAPRPVLVATLTTTSAIQCAYCAEWIRGAVELFHEGCVLVPLLLFGTVENHLSQ